LPAEPGAGERHQRGVAGTAADIIGVELFAGGADIVDDDAVPRAISSARKMAAAWRLM